ncbi:MAG: hypothetical protein JSW07_04445 [bacterium]|nr:MAG: hypothetical protein JSW07_04445 [bacterium]
MAEGLSPESKLYVKEELEKVRNEFKEELKDAQSKATKIFTTVALIIGLLASVGVYGLAKSSIKNAIEDELGKTTIKNLETDANMLVVEIENLEGQAKSLVTDTNTYVNQARDDVDKMKSELVPEIKNLEGQAKALVTETNTYLKQAREDIDTIKKELEPLLVKSIQSELTNRGLSDQKIEQIHDHHQNAIDGGFTWIGNIALIWGTHKSTKDSSEVFPIGWNHFPNDCFTVLTSLPGEVVILEDNKHFRFNRLQGYTGTREFTFLAIGH